MALSNTEAIEIWKRIIETQMHFNEMATKSRTLGLTLVVAALGFTAVLIGRGDDFSIVLPICTLEVRIHIAVMILIACALGMYAVKTLDIDIYHNMLRGAVKYGEEFETKNLADPTGIKQGLTTLVSLHSRYPKVTKDADVYKGEGIEKLAGEKLKKFYWASIITILGFAFAIFATTQQGLRIERPMPTPQSISVTTP